MSLDLALERRALDAFEEALDWPLETREARLQATFGRDPALLTAVRALIAAEREAELLPTQPPEPMAGPDVAPPDRVGVYRLEELIGRGGMGVVYRGQRDDGLFDQTVAVKLIRAGLFGRAAAQQFEVERRILARLRHPHIAQLFDGGVTDDGLSYIVMELLPGEPITEWCDARGLGVRERLALFLDACDAIQYAHQQLVAHADIKPSNIVVDDGYGVKLLDFGIARLLEDAPGDADEKPRIGATPAWSSPQQTRGERPTPADDIFSLGVLLERLTQGCADTDADLRAVAAKARADEPEGRYGAVNDLAADLRRWLDRYPVSARPAGRRHDLALFWKRRRLPIVLTAAAVAALIGASAVTTGLYLQAEAARRQAEQRFNEVHALSRFMLHDVTDALEKYPGAAALRRELADRARTYLEGLSKVPGASRDLRLEAAQGYAKTGEVLAQASTQNLGDPTAGKAALARAEHDLRALHAELPARDDITLSLARTLKARATVLATADNDNAGALRMLAEACPLAQGVAARHPRLGGAALERWECKMARASVLNVEGRFAEMMPLLEEALVEGRRAPKEPSLVSRRALVESTNLTLLGDARYYLGDPQAGLAAYQATAGVLEAAMTAGPDVRLYDRLAFTDYNVASTLSELKRSREALAWIERGVVTVSRMRAFEDSSRARHIENVVRLQKAVTLGELGRYDEAIGEARANIASRKAKAAAQSDDYEARRAVPVALRPLSELYRAAGRRAEACAALREADGDWRALDRSGGLNGFDKRNETTLVAAMLRDCPPIASRDVTGR